MTIKIEPLSSDLIFSRRDVLKSGGALIAASPSSAWRASAAAARTCGPPRWIDELELVAPWSGVTLVSSRTALS